MRRSWRGEGSRKWTRHPHSILTHKTSNPPEAFVWHWWASIIQSELWSLAWHPKVTAPQKQTGVQRTAHYCLILSQKSEKSLKMCVFILECSGLVIAWRAKTGQVPHCDYLWMFNDIFYFFSICHKKIFFNWDNFKTCKYLAFLIKLLFNVDKKNYEIKPLIWP